MHMTLDSRYVVALALLVGGVAACTSEAVDDSGLTDQAYTAAASDEKDLSKKELLGKRLFEDQNLSEPRGQSCASCHDPNKAFTGNSGSPIEAVSRGAKSDALGGRNAPTAMYLATSPGFSFAPDADEPGSFTPTGGHFWDGRANDLAAQAKGPFLNPGEMNNPDAAAVVKKVEAGAYASLVREVYGADAFADVDRAYDAFAQAISAFEHTKRFQPFSSKFDDYLRGKAKLSTKEARGFALFKDPEKGNCVGCHAGDVKSNNPEDWLFTDFTYDNIGVPRNDKIPSNADRASFDLGLCKRPGIEKVLPKGVSAEDFCGAFKVPTLRNIEKTGPYMHNGVFTNLRDVVKFYVTRDTNPELWYPKNTSGEVQTFNDVPTQYRKNVNTEEVPLDRKQGEQPRLTESEIDDVVAFLLTLTDR